mgnify:CR=1 FL=1
MAIDWLILEKIQQIFGSGFCDWFMLELQFWEMQGLFGLS